MIKLTLHPDTRPALYSFEKDIVVIGAPSSQADLSLPDEGLQEVHVQIIEQNGRFFVVNCANDPFVTLNGIPFGKKLLKPFDRLKIGKTTLQFEGVHHEPEPAIQKTLERNTPQFSTDGELPRLLEKVLGMPQKTSAPFSPTHPLQNLEKTQEEAFDDFDLDAELEKLNEWAESGHPLMENELNDIDIEALVRQAEELDSAEPFEEISPKPPQTPLHETEPVAAEANAVPFSETDREAETPPPFKRTSIKDLYFKDLEEDTSFPPSINEIPTEGSPKEEVFNRKKMLLIALGLGVILILLFTAFYINASEKSEEEEIRAAESVADIAMALTHAQINHIIPQNQNWSDPEFLRNNLIAVLSAEFPSLAHLDSHGQLFNSPYLLRIYTNEDLSHFLVMAQPAPGLLQWFIPKATILVDSHSMELRKTKDLKSLNRLLVNPTLDGTNAKEISGFIRRQTEIIPLASLAEHDKHLGFSPLKALELIRPGAENLVYNAPRYYRFGEEIMLQASYLSGDQEGSHEIALLQEDVRNLIQYPNIVLYSSQGIQAALESQKALALFFPDVKFLIAYLQFNSHGAIKNSHLLMDDGQTDAALTPSSDPAPKNRVAKEVSLGSLSSLAASSIATREPDKNLETDILFEDINHPLFFHLSALTAARQQALQPITDKIILSIKAQNLSPSLDFTVVIQKLLEKHQAIDSAHRDKVVEGIAHLYDEYSGSGMPLVDFMHYVKVAGLSAFTEKYKIQEFEKTEIVERNIDEELQGIKDSSTLHDLDKHAHAAAELITLNAIPDPDKIIQLQNDVHNEVLKKLKALILSSTGQLTKSEFTKEGRSLLARIMRTAWITDQEEYDYYMSEYDYLLQEHNPEDARPAKALPSPVAEVSERTHEGIGPRRSHRVKTTM